jgi:hypothetical protein
MDCFRREIHFGDLEGWSAIPALPLVENVSGESPMQPTTIQCAWTDNSLRVLFQCLDSDPWATITERDGQLWEEEVVEVFLDPVGDRESYFEIEVNPLNAVLDLVLRKNRSGYRKDFAWDCERLQTKVTCTEIGWNAELLIPFASITSDRPRVGTEWLANFYRIDRPKDRDRELSAWTPTLLPNFHVPERFGRLQFR